MSRTRYPPWRAAFDQDGKPLEPRAVEQARAVAAQTARHRFDQRLLHLVTTGHTMQTRAQTANDIAEQQLHKPFNPIWFVVSDSDNQIQRLLKATSLRDAITMAWPARKPSEALGVMGVQTSTKLSFRTQNDVLLAVASYGASGAKVDMPGANQCSLDKTTADALLAVEGEPLDDKVRAAQEEAAQRWLLVQRDQHQAVVDRVSLEGTACPVCRAHKDKPEMVTSLANHLATHGHVAMERGLKVAVLQRASLCAAAGVWPVVQRNQLADLFESLKVRWSVVCARADGAEKIREASRALIAIQQAIDLFESIDDHARRADLEQLAAAALAMTKGFVAIVAAQDSLAPAAE